MRDYERTRESLERAFEMQEQRSMHNAESALADYRYWRSDPSGKRFLNDQERQDSVDDALKEVRKHSQAALSQVVHEYVRGEVGRTLGDVVTPSQIEEGNTLPIVEKPDVVAGKAYHSTNDFKGKMLSPKVKVNTKEFEAGTDVFRNVALRYGQKWDGSESWLKASMNFIIAQQVYLAGNAKYRIENGERSRQWGASLNWYGVGPTYTYDADMKHTVWFGFDSAQISPKKD
jgi:hypothetical protein